MLLYPVATRWLFCLSTWLLIGLMSIVLGGEPITPRQEVIRLWNGKNLDGLTTWLQESNYEDPKGVFQVDDGVLRISGDGMGYIRTNQAYRDYHLICEFRWGERTWGSRKGCARDSGIMVHCQGPDGSLSNMFMASIEAQVLEGGVGDCLVCSGNGELGEAFPFTMVAEVVEDRDGEPTWKRGGERRLFTGGPVRINWFNRDPDWRDETGFRGVNDVESPHGQWTRLEVICDGGRISQWVNGVEVNEGLESKPNWGKILIQCEGAEIVVRRWELWPLGKAPEDPLGAVIVG